MHSYHPKWPLALTLSALLLAACSAPAAAPYAPVPRANTASAQIGPARATSPLLYVGNFSATSSISEYAKGGSTPVGIITQGIKDPYALAFDRLGDLYVANINAEDVTVYKPGSVKPMRALKSGIVAPDALAIDRSGRLYVANTANGSPAKPANTIAVFVPGATKPKYSISNGVSGPGALAFDGKGNLYVKNGDTVTIYAPGSKTPELTISDCSDNVVTAIALDAKDNLYEAAGYTICEFRPGTTAPLRTFATKGEFEELLFDGSGNLYALSDYGGGLLTVYSGGGPKVLRSIRKGIAQPTKMVFDKAGNLYVASSDGIAVYAPDSVKPAKTITEGVTNPFCVAVP